MAPGSLSVFATPMTPAPSEPNPAGPPDHPELKSYDNQNDDFLDEFFLVQFPPHSFHPNMPSLSDSNVLNKSCVPTIAPSKLTYHLNEYYNDYEDCLDSYKVYTNSGKVVIVHKEELSDDFIFNDIFLPFKSRSAPDIMDSSFVTLTYDPGPDMSRRKSDFVPGYQGANERSVFYETSSWLFYSSLIGKNPN